MKKLITVFLALIFVLCIACSFTACNKEKKTIDIPSAYAIAQEGGYAGTLDEFIALLENGADSAITNVTVTADGKLKITYLSGETTMYVIISGEQGDKGTGIISIEKTATEGLVDTYTITYSDNTTTTFTVTNGANGKDGKSAYELYCAKYPNYNKTESEWLDDLLNNRLYPHTHNYIATWGVINALGHDVVHHDAKAPTCTEVGWNAYDTCSRCDYTTYAELDALGHDVVHHNAKAPTCTEIGWNAYDTCSRCDYTTYAELDALGHNLTHVNAVQATTSAKGNIEYWLCSTCGKYFSNSTGSTEISMESTVIAKLIIVVEVGSDTVTVTLADDANPANGIDISEALSASAGKDIAIDLGGGNGIVFNSFAGSQLSGTTTVALSVGNNDDYEGAKLVLSITINGTGVVFTGVGKATVTYSFTDSVPEGKVAKVYYVNGTIREDMNATFADGILSFDTTHFSDYIVVFEDAVVAPPGGGDNQGLSGGAIAGIVIGSIVVVAAICAGVFFFLKKKKAPVTTDGFDK